MLIFLIVPFLLVMGSLVLYQAIIFPYFSFSENNRGETPPYVHLLIRLVIHPLIAFTLRFVGRWAREMLRLDGTSWSFVLEITNASSKLIGRLMVTTTGNVYTSIALVLLAAVQDTLFRLSWAPRRRLMLWLTANTAYPVSEKYRLISAALKEDDITHQNRCNRTTASLSWCNDLFPSTEDLVDFLGDKLTEVELITPRSADSSRSVNMLSPRGSPHLQLPQKPGARTSVVVDPDMAALDRVKFPLTPSPTPDLLPASKPPMPDSQPASPPSTPSTPSTPDSITADLVAPQTNLGGGLSGQSLLLRDPSAILGGDVVEVGTAHESKEAASGLSEHELDEDDGLWDVVSKMSGPSDTIETLAVNMRVSSLSSKGSLGSGHIGRRRAYKRTRIVERTPTWQEQLMLNAATDANGEYVHELASLTIASFLPLLFQRHSACYNFYHAPLGELFGLYALQLVIEVAVSVFVYAFSAYVPPPLSRTSC